MPAVATQVAALGGRPLVESQAAPATVTDNPRALRFSIQIHPLVLLAVPGTLIAVLLLFLLLPGKAPLADSSARVVADAPAATAKAVQQGAAEQEEDDEEPLGATEPAALEEPLLPPELSAKKTAELERRHAEAQRKAEREQLLTAARGRLKVKVYYRQDCVSCSEARRHLAARGVRAEAIDIDQEPKARARHRSLNPRGRLPTIEVEGKVLRGFEPKKLDRALDRAAAARLKKGQ